MGHGARNRIFSAFSMQNFQVGKTPKIPFLCLSLLPNPTETLATRGYLISYSPSGMFLDFKTL